MAKKTTKEIGDQLESHLENVLKEQNTENVEIKRTKGSGNQRGDGDIKIISKDEFHTPLLLIDAKNSDEKKGGIPRKYDVDKTIEEAKKHSALYGAVVVRSGKDNKTYAACEWSTMLALLRCLIQVEDEHV